MAIVVKDRVKVTSTTTGTSDFTLGSASLGFQDFAIIGNGNETYYAAVDAITGDWEVGIGTYTTAGPTLTRTTILESSAAGAKVSFSAGSKDVFVTYPAERAVYLDTAGSYPVQNTFNTLNATTATLTGGTVSTTPSVGTDLVNKSYVDTVAAQGIVYHDPVYVESPVALTATYNQPGGPGVGVGATLTNAGTKAALVIDGVLMTTTKRVLIYTQANAFENGVYTVTTVGTPDPGGTNWVLTRATDADTYAVNSPTSLGQGDAFFVQAGDTGAGELYSCNTVGVITFGTTNITFAQISATVPYFAGTGLNLNPITTFNISNVGTAGTYGSSSNVPVFVTNAQGQVTSVTNTGIAITSAAVSGLAASATTDTTNAANITSGVLPSGRISGSYTGLTGTGALAAGSLATGFTAVSAPLGGTGQTSYAVGDLLYASTSTALSKLADVAVGNALISGGVGSAPSYGKIGLATHVSGTLPVANGGTGVTASTGTIAVVLSNSPTLVTPILGTPQSVTLTNGTGLPISTGVSGLGLNVAAFLATPSSANLAAALTNETGTGSVVFATSPTLVTPALGTPSALVGTNITGTAAGLTAGTVTTNANLTGGVTSVGNVATVVTNANLTGGVTSVGNATTVVTNANLTGGVTSIGNVATVVTNANLTGGVTSVGNATTVVTNANLTGAVTSVGNATSLGSFTSAQLASALTDETGTGSAVFATSPTLVTPALGTPSALVGTNITGINASALSTGTVAPARLGSGTPSASNFLRGDGAWAAIPSSAPTTTQVLDATAGASAGAVGTYAFLKHNTVGTAVTAGTNYSGGALLFSGLGPGPSSPSSTTTGTSGSAPSGTWKAMGTTTPFNDSYNAITVFLRIS